MYKLKKEGTSMAFAGVAQTISGPISDKTYQTIAKKNPDAAKFFEKVEEVKESKSASAPVKSNG